MTSTPTGFMVVLSRPEQRAEGSVRRNSKYLGVNRLPIYPPEYAGEEDPLEDYFFGDVKSDDTNLIPELATALHLRDRLGASRRQFDVIVCCHGRDDSLMRELAGHSVRELGYDIATVRGDNWSIVDDFCGSDWARPMLCLLNEYGLFTSRDEAQRYLDEYRNHKEADWDMPFDIVYVAEVLHSRATT